MGYHQATVIYFTDKGIDDVVIFDFIGIYVIKNRGLGEIYGSYRPKITYILLFLLKFNKFLQFFLKVK